jgi:hypothetical protein
VALTMITPFYTWVYPGDVGIPRLRLAFEIWWLAFAAFTGLLLPRLLKRSGLESDRDAHAED